MICVENMPPGVHPGSLMGEIHDLLREPSRPRLAWRYDTGPPILRRSFMLPSPPARCWQRPMSTITTAGAFPRSARPGNHQLDALGKFPGPCGLSRSDHA